MERQQPDEDGLVDCEFCGGTGRERRGGANNPDARNVGPCGYCDGSGKEKLYEPPTDDDGDDVREIYNAVVTIFNSNCRDGETTDAYPLCVATALALLIKAFDRKMPGFRGLVEQCLASCDRADGKKQ